MINYDQGPYELVLLIYADRDSINSPCSITKSYHLSYNSAKRTAQKLRREHLRSLWDYEKEKLFTHVRIYHNAFDDDGYETIEEVGKAFAIGGKQMTWDKTKRNV